MCIGVFDCLICLDRGGTRWHVHKLTACFDLRTFRAPDLHYALQLRVTPQLAVHEGSARA